MLCPLVLPFKQPKTDVRLDIWCPPPPPYPKLSMAQLLVVQRVPNMNPQSVGYCREPTIRGLAGWFTSQFLFFDFQSSQEKNRSRLIQRLEFFEFSPPIATNPSANATLQRSTLHAPAPLPPGAAAGAGAACASSSAAASGPSAAWIRRKLFEAEASLWGQSDIEKLARCENTKKQLVMYMHICIYIYIYIYILYIYIYIYVYIQKQF